MKSDFRNEIIAFIKANYTDNININFKDEIIAKIYIIEISCQIIFHSLDGIIINDLHTIENKLAERNIHIWEDQWLFQNRKVRSRLLSILGKTKKIHARKTKVIAIDNKQLLDFLKRSHLLVPIKAKYKYGLMYNSSLVAIMSFSKSRIINRDGTDYNSFEMLRFCSELNVTVVGGFSKLLSHFIKVNKPDDIMTYVDVDWSNGVTYKEMGFELLEIMPSMEFLINSESGIREYPHLLFERFSISMDNLPYVDKINYLKDKGFKSVKNSGNYKFLLKLKPVGKLWYYLYN